MRMRWMIIAILLTPLIGCQTFYHPSKPASCCPPPPPKVISVVHKVPDFNRIDVAGDVNVRIHTHARRAWIGIHGDSRDVENITWTVEHRTIILRVKDDVALYGPVDINLGVPHLHYLGYHGKGKLTGHHMATQQLDVDIANDLMTDLDGRINLHYAVFGGDGRVHLRTGVNRDLNMVLVDDVHVKIEGVSYLRTLNMSDNSYLSMHWVKAKTLRVLMKNSACAYLAGTAQLALIDLFGDANLNARYLRTTEAYVKTHDRATARISVLTTQHALARDNSNIYYYNAPTYMNNFMAGNGSILNMGTLGKT